MAKNRTELLHSIKGRLENFINNPALNPDFSDSCVGDDPKESTTGYLQDILDDVDSYIDAYEESEHLFNLVKMHDEVESTALQAMMEMQDIDLPHPDTISEAYDEFIRKEES